MRNRPSRISTRFLKSRGPKIRLPDSGVENSGSHGTALKNEKGEPGLHVQCDFGEEGTAESYVAWCGAGSWSQREESL